MIEEVFRKFTSLKHKCRENMICILKIEEKLEVEEW